MSQNLSEGESETEESITPVLRTAPPMGLGLDLGDEVPHNVVGLQGSPGPSLESARRDDNNPFSFKHFLREGLGRGSRQDVGNRPDVGNLPDVGNVSSNGNHGHPRRVPDFSSALPDFVQDHLVLEQSFLGTIPPTHNLVLPEFEDGLDDPSPEQEVPPESRAPIPLDLPGLLLGAAFPLDLPVASNGQGRTSGPVIAEVGASSSLPDFLSDGAVCPSGDTSPSTVVVSHNGPTNDNPAESEVEFLRRQLAEQTRQCTSLRAELNSTKARAERETRDVATALETVEHNLETSNRRASAAESSVLKLRQEIKQLKLEVANLRSENQALRHGESSSGASRSYYSAASELPSSRLAQELRNAASSAEHSLRQLLTGVDNLRVMASTLENMHRIEEERDRFCSYNDSDDAGPAL